MEIDVPFDELVVWLRRMLAETVVVSPKVS